MKFAPFLLAIVLAAPVAAADTRRIDADESADFSTFKRFLIRDGRATSRRAEIDNALTVKAIHDAIRSSLQDRGLAEVVDRPDLVVTFRVTEESQRQPTGRGNRNGPASLHVGTLVIDLMSSATNRPVWHGTYVDEEAAPGRLADNLPKDARKLLADYPPKKHR